MPKLKSKYDVVIIGAGLGGLECGYILSKEGYTVCILEKNAQIGGNLQTFKRDRIKFDSGVHYIGGIEEGQPLYPYFKYLNLLDTIQYKKLEKDGFDVISFSGDENMYPHAQGHNNFVDQLVKYFPNEERGIRKYVDKIKEVCQHFNMHNLYHENTDIDEVEFFDLSAKKVIDSCTSDEKLRNVLAGSNFLYAGEGESSPFYMHALISDSFISSAYKVDSSDDIAKQLRRDIKQFGGEIFVNKEVVNISNDTNQVHHVELASGEKIEAKYYISNIHPTLTFQMMNTEGMRKMNVSRMINLKNTVSSFLLYVKLKPRTLKFDNFNRYHYFQDDVWSCTVRNDDGTIRGIGSFSSEDPQNPGFADSIAFITYMSYDEVLKWDASVNTTLKKNKRGEDYHLFKEEKANEIIEQLNEVYPGFSEKIESCHTASPLTQRDYIGSPNGGIYGILRDYKSPLKSFINSNTKLQNLFLTGQNTLLHGVLGVTVGAVVTCKHILGDEYLMSKIKAGITLSEVG